MSGPARYEPQAARNRQPFHPEINVLLRPERQAWGKLTKGCGILLQIIARAAILMQKSVSKLENQNHDNANAKEGEKEDGGEDTSDCRQPCT